MNNSLSPPSSSSPIRIGLQTWGSTGDINPFLALAAALAAAGHSVTLAITSIERRDYAQEGDRYGFAVRQAGWIGRDVSELNRMGVRIFRERNPLKQMSIIFNELLGDNIPFMYLAAQNLAAENDLLIGHFISHPTQLAAEQAGKPYLTLSLNHGTIANSMVAPNPLPNLGRWLNRLQWRLFEWVINRLALPSVHRLRHLVGAPLPASLKPIWQSPLGNLIAVSREFVPPNPDWSKSNMVCGYLELPQTQIAPLPEELAAFLQAGTSPIYITFGSMIGLPEHSQELEEMLALLTEAVSLAGCRAIIQAHWSMTGTTTDDTQIFRVERIDHRAVFPHCAAVIHHGGAGTCHSATACGCPSIIVAHVADQFFWGDLLHGLGIAPRKLLRHGLTAASLAYAIRRVLNDTAMQQRAREIGARIAAENGAHEAVAMIEAIYASVSATTPGRR